MPNTENQVKPATTYEEQLAILKSRGLHVDCDAAAVRTLSSVNYYRLRGYYCHLQKQDQFVSGTSFTHLEMLHRFDSELRALLFPVLYDIEITARTRIAYDLAHNWGALEYRNADRFKTDSMDEEKRNETAKQHEELLQKINKELARSKNCFVLHYRNSYGGNFPIWVAIEILSFGVLSTLYKNLPFNRKNEIAKTYDGVDAVLLENWLHICADLRNICAHYDRIYYRPLLTAAKIETLTERLIRQKCTQNFTIRSNSLFAYLLCVRRLVHSDIWNAFYPALDALFQRYQPFVQEIHLGFPYQWKWFLAQKSS